MAITHKRNIFAYMDAFSHGSSGSDIVFIETAKRFSDFNITIVTSEMGKVLCEDNGLKAKFLVTTKEKVFSHPIITYFKRLIISLLFPLKVNVGDIFIGSSDFFPDVFPIVLNKLLHRHSIWLQHIHHFIPIDRRLQFIAQQVSIILIKYLSDAVLVDTELMKKELINRGIKPSKIYVNYLGIRKFDTSLSNVHTAYEAVYMARLMPYKGIYDIIDIWAEVVKELPDANVGIIGKGSDDIILEFNTRLAAKNLQNNVILLGFLSNTDAFKIISNSKVFLFPSHEEGFGLVGLEAQVLGIPVIAWNLPVFEEIFTSGMFKIAKGDINEYARVVIKVLKQEGEWKKLSESALTNAARFSWDATAQRELAIINKLT